MGRRRRRVSPAAWTAGACAMASTLLGDFARAADPDALTAPTQGRTLTLQIMGGVDLTLTDNVGRAPRDESSDIVISPVVAVTLDLSTPRATADLAGELRYDAYASESDRNGLWVAGSAAGSYAVIDDALWLKGQGAVTNSSISTFASSASNRHGTPGRVQLTTYDVGPEARVQIGDSATLAGAARYAQVIYGNLSNDPNFRLPEDDSIVQLVGNATLGDDAGRLQLQTAGEYLRDDLGFKSVTAVQSMFLRTSPALRVFGRAGYEELSQREMLDISAPILSAGLEYRPSGKSEFRLEGGRRYHRNTWSAEAVSQVTQWLYVAGGYSEIVQPDQVAVARSFRAFAEAAENLPPPLVRADLTLPGGLYNETSLYRSADLRILYARAGNRLAASLNWVDRKFLTTGGRDRTLLTDVVFNREVRPDLTVGVQGRYAHTYESPRFGPSRAFRLSAEAAYRLNSRTDIRASISRLHSRELVTGGDRVTENAILIGLRRRF